MRKRSRNEGGQASVELVLMLPVLVTLLYVMFQFGQVYLQYQEVSSATSEGARRASNMAGVADPGRTSTIVAAVRNGASVSASAEFNPNALSVAVSSTWTPGSTVMVTSTYPASVTIFGVTLFSGNLKTQRTARVIN
jgi:Flp pilus assembly protein TadG